jgi:bifunctional DNase/RNase
MAENFIEMEVREIQTSEDPRELPIIVLAEKQGEREFPIFIGHIEARALEEAVLGSAANPFGFPRRPMTHDLILNTIDGLKAKFNRVLVTRLETGTFYGALELETFSGEVERIDSRPSDAMVLAMKRKIPIFVEENVLAEVQRGDFDSPE